MTFVDKNGVRSDLDFSDPDVVRITTDGVTTEYPANGFDWDVVPGYSSAKARSSGWDTMNDGIVRYGTSLADSLSLIAAIKSGQPLSIAASSLRLAVSLDHMVHGGTTLYGVSAAANVAGSLLSVMSVETALKNGDTFAAVVSGANALKYTVSAYHDFLIYEFGVEGAKKQLGYNLTGEVNVGYLGNAIGALNIAYEINQHDWIGAGVTAVSLIPGMQWVGVVYAIYNVAKGLFGKKEEEPEFISMGRVAFSGDKFVVTGVRTENMDATIGNSMAQSVADALNHILDLAGGDLLTDPKSKFAAQYRLEPTSTDWSFEVGYENGKYISNVDSVFGPNLKPESFCWDGGKAFDSAEDAVVAATLRRAVELQFDGDNMVERALHNTDALELDQLNADLTVAAEWELYRGAPALMEATLSSQNGDAFAAQWTYVQNRAATLRLDSADRGLAYDWVNLPPAGDDTIPWLAAFGNANLRDPLVLDLDGDGVETLSVHNADIHFDYDGNGFQTRTGWISADDGLLVRDLDGDGKVTNAAELFSDYTQLANGGTARHGFEALASLDDNGDGKVDAADAAWSSLKVWRDLNGNGVSDAGELQSLQQAGVAVINVAYVDKNTVDASGNQHGQVGTYVRADGSTAAAEDIWLAAESAHTVATEELPVSDDIAALPELRGYGTVYGLHQAMVRDTTGRLKAAIQTYASTTDAAARAAMVDQIIFLWAGTADIDPNSRPLYYQDARKLGALEQLAAAQFQQWYHYNGITNAWNLLVKDVSASLERQTVLAPYYNLLKGDVADGSASFDLSAVLAKFQTDLTANRVPTLVLLSDFIANAKETTLGGTAAFTAFYQSLASVGEDVATAINQGFGTIRAGSAEADSLTGGTCDDVLTGFAGNDSLSGGDGRDHLTGGTGDDTLRGGTGDDTYSFTFGDGTDTIIEGKNEGADVLLLSGVAISDVRLSRQGNDLLVLLGNGGGSVRVVDQFASDTVRLETIRIGGTDWSLSSGLSLTGSDGADHLVASSAGDTLAGGQGADTLDAGDGNDRLDGGADNDTLYGGAGRDVLLGGVGNDLLYGGAGNDYYLVQRGHGNDVIEESSWWDGGTDTLWLGNDIPVGDVRLWRDGNDLMVFTGAGDSVRLRYQFSGNVVETLRFADGTAWDLAHGLTLTGSAEDDTGRGTDENDILFGMAGNDTLNGEGGNDTLNGGSGDDLLKGGGGNDTYVLGLGGGSDVIDEDWANSAGDSILLANGLTLADARLNRVGNDLLVILVDGSQIRVSNHFLTSQFSVETLRDTAGNTLNLMGDLPIIGTDTAEALRGGGGNDTLMGNGGNDTLNGEGGNDTLNGGTGDDLLKGGAGGDTYILGPGGGSDVIDEDWANSAGDSILLANGLTLADARLNRVGNDLLVMLADGSQIKVANHFLTSQFSVETLRDTAGNTLNLMGDLPIVGTNAAEELRGGGGNDTLMGNGGNDTLNGEGGNDTLNGGSGDDLLKGGGGNDTYVLGLGGGSDVVDEDWASSAGDSILLADGLTLADARLNRVGNDLLVMLADGSQIKVSNHFLTSQFSVETLRDTAGNTLNLMGDLPIIGTDGAEALRGGSGNDTLMGNGGNDTLNGGGGNDTYVLSLGGGSDVIDEENTKSTGDSILLADGLSLTDARLNRVGDDLVISLADGSKLTVKQHFYWYTDGYAVE
ncbi:MAG: calcium-binding protein, partial [Bacteroidota bacterium]